MSQQADINIEFAHIYVNENFDSEHKKAAQIAKKQKDFNEKQGLIVTTTILLDDYNPTESFFSERLFLKNLRKLGMEPDYMASEAKLAFWAEPLLEEMRGKLQKKYLHYILKKGKVPCSFLVAVWHLVRLGAFDLEHSNLLRNLGGSEKPFVAKKTITILPHRYESVEKNGHDIIASTKYENYNQNIEHIFF